MAQSRFQPIFLLLLLLVAPFCSAETNSHALPAFPGAEGFGALATGGRGGEIYLVTTLADRGPGSFRDAVSKGHRTVIFTVAGYIELASPVHVASDITIAGQTAPGLGVCTKNFEVTFDGSRNIIARYFRMRQGLTNRQDRKCTLNLHKCRDVILDHVSVEWGRWDCIGFADAKDVTLQYCIIGQGVDPQRFGCLCESDNVTFSHNLWIDNHSRNPKSKGTVQFINNVVYNWGVVGYVGGHSESSHAADLINNYFIKGPSSSNHFAGELTATDHIFQSGNYVDLDRDGQLNGRPAKPSDFSSATIVAARALTPQIPVTEDSAADAYTKVLANAGDSLHRDAIDTRLLEQLQSLGKTGAIIHDPKEMDGFGKIPPAAAHPLHLAAPNQILPSGYTKLEEYINAISPSR